MSKSYLSCKLIVIVWSLFAFVPAFAEQGDNGLIDLHAGQANKGYELTLISVIEAIEQQDLALGLSLIHI